MMTKRPTKKLSFLLTIGLVVLLNLSAAVTTFAWFTVTVRQPLQYNNITASGASHRITNLSLLKFDFQVIEGFLDESGKPYRDYLHPEYGKTHEYDYDEEENRYYYVDSSSGEDTKVYFSEMNKYDPLAAYVGSMEKRSMNCNIFYKVEVETSVDVPLVTVVGNKIAMAKTDKQFYGTEILNFNVFSTTNVAEVQAQKGSIDHYYPNYLTTAMKENLTELEEEYYALSYLNSITTSKHFYSDEEGEPTAEQIHVCEDTTFPNDAGHFYLYIAVDYCTTKFDDYLVGMQTEDRAVLNDYSFNIEMREGA